MERTPSNEPPGDEHAKPPASLLDFLATLEPLDEEIGPIEDLPPQPVCLWDDCGDADLPPSDE